MLNTLTAFGIDMYSGGTTVQLALYTDSSGAPGTLVAETVLTSVSTGDNELSVSGGSVSVAAGDYWIVEIPGTSPWIQVVEDSSTSATTWYRSYTAGIGFPSTGGSGATYTDTTFASWLVGY